MKTKTAKRKSRADVHPCACGCGQKVARTFAMGHDAKAKSMLLKAERGELRLKDLPRTLRAAEVRKGDGLIAQMLRDLDARSKRSEEA